jgi:hypothetical protein
MQKAQAYNEQGRRIEFSNAAVAGQVYDPSAPQAERIRLLQRAAAAHAHREGWHAFDYYIPMDGDARSEAPGTSSAGAEIYIPSVSGGRVAYGTQQHGFGHYASIYDERGNLISQTGHGDTRRPRPQGRTFPSQPAAGGGGGVNLSTGYESLEQLSGQLASLDPRFNTNTPDGRAALAIALAIGGTEVYGRGATGTDFFTRRGGTGNNMLGFAQFNLGFHRANTDTPGEYTDFLADILTGDRAQPNGRRARNWSAELSRAVQSGQIGSGAELQQWLRRSGLGGSNWQGIDDGWSRVPGLPDRLFQMLRGGDNRQASNNRTTNITVNIASATDPARTRQEVFNGVHAAMPYLDEFEQTRRNSSDRNPRNSGNLSPVYG